MTKLCRLISYYVVNRSVGIFFCMLKDKFHWCKFHTGKLLSTIFSGILSMYVFDCSAAFRDNLYKCFTTNFVIFLFL